VRHDQPQRFNPRARVGRDIAHDLDASIHLTNQEAFDIEEFVKLFELELQ